MDGSAGIGGNNNMPAGGLFHKRYFNMTSRRDFLRSTMASAMALPFAGMLNSVGASSAKELFEISLAEWSLHNALFGRKGDKLDNLDFAKTAASCGIHAIEFVNQFFKDKVTDESYLTDLNKRAAEHNVKHVLIMIDGEGQLGDPNADKRTQAVNNHKKWVDAAKALNCHSIRVNAGTDWKLPVEEQQKLAVDGLSRLSEYGKEQGIGVIVENHGGNSSNGKWLAKVIKEVHDKNSFCGTLPDFGNWWTTSPHSQPRDYDMYEGTAELMPFAKGVSAKSYDFDAEGNETAIDYVKMIRLVLKAGYRGYIGIEYEGSKLGEIEGIKATKALLEKVRAQLASEFPS